MTAPAAAWRCVLCDSSLAGLSVTRSRTDRAICTWCEGELARTHRKRCRKCNVPQPLDAFCKDTTAPDERHQECRACKASRHAEYYAARKEVLRAVSRERQKGYRATGRPRSSVRNVEQEREYGRRPERRAKQVQHVAAWRTRNPDKVRAYAATGAVRRKLKAIRAMRGQV